MSIHLANKKRELPFSSKNFMVLLLKKNKQSYLNQHVHAHVITSRFVVLETNRTLIPLAAIVKVQSNV